jgi:two-component system chemotaxis response regulator CheY
MRVLIADDQRSFGTALADMVRYCGHEVVATVGSGLEAIQAFTLHKPDLVLMDYRMPKLNGATACRHILAKDPTARIVLLSAWSPLDGSDESGAMCFLPKPVDLARLNATLLTIAQSIPSFAPFFDENLNNNPPGSDTIVPFISVPQEIISPIEHFPIEMPGPAAGSVPQEDDIIPPPFTVMAKSASPAEETISSSKPRRRKKRAPTQ